MFTETQNYTPQDAWTEGKFAAFGAELDAVHAEVRSQLGQDDVDHIKKINRIARIAELVGRSLIHFSLDPFTWSAGVFALSIHNQLHATEIGHSALHGAWDGIKGAEIFASNTYKWKSPVDDASWKHEHNILHHQYTNIIGRDPDLNYGSLRPSEKMPWTPAHLLQSTQFFWTAPIFMWVIASYASGLNDLVQDDRDENYAKVLPDRKPETIARAWKKTLRKMGSYSLYNFALWPALAGPLWWKVLGANLTADVMRNIYSAATIYAGHFGDDLEYYPHDFKPKGRGEWYKAQVEAAHNYDVPLPLSVLSGALDAQIEHHLFPKLPPNRLRQIQPQVEAICKRYGVSYNRGNWGKTLVGAVKRLAKLSLPSSFKLAKIPELLELPKLLEFPKPRELAKRTRISKRSPLSKLFPTASAA